MLWFTEKRVGLRGAGGMTKEEEEEEEEEDSLPRLPSEGKLQIFNYSASRESKRFIMSFLGWHIRGKKVEEFESKRERTKRDRCANSDIEVQFGVKGGPKLRFELLLRVRGKAHQEA